MVVEFDEFLCHEGVEFFCALCPIMRWFVPLCMRASGKKYERNQLHREVDSNDATLLQVQLRGVAV